jgi:hypothetical protein
MSYNEEIGMDMNLTAKLSSSLPREKAFYFFTSIGNYTGVSASSLKEFMEKLNEVNVKSLEFHLGRGDFERWISEVLQDAELAGEVKRLEKFNLVGESLRSELLTIVSRRFKRLTGQTGQSQSRD